MLELFNEINYLAILVAAAGAMIVSAVWYNPKVFGKSWMEENGLKEKDLVKPGPAMAQAFVANVILAFGLSTLFLIVKYGGGDMAWMDGARWGIFLSVIIHGAAGFPNYVFENRSTMLFLIHLGNSLLGMAVMGAILAVWN